MHESTLPLSTEGQRLARRLENLPAPAREAGPVFHAEGIGAGFYLAYEQLRNATEYREHHLLLRAAIERWLRRWVRWDGTMARTVGPELVTELTQAGYLRPDTVPLTVVKQIDEIVRDYAGVYGRAARMAAFDARLARRWLVQMASVELETLLSPNIRLAPMMAFAYEHYIGAVDRAAMGLSAMRDDLFGMSVFLASQRAIFKSDVATARFYAVGLFMPDWRERGAEELMAFMVMVDDGFEEPETNRLVRLMERYGAPMRVLRELVVEGEIAVDELAEREGVLVRVRRMCRQLYDAHQKQLNGRIIRTIVFVLVTKVLVGMAIELPYDVLLYGVVAWLPLAVNIAFPPLYMALIGLRISPPGRRDTDLTVSSVDRILYEGAGEKVTYKIRRRVVSQGLQTVFTLVYAVGFLVSFGLVGWVLYRLGYNAMNGLIFVIFFSAVSFLGLRLRRWARELAMLDENKGLVEGLIDFLSAPFVQLGWWISDRYSRINLVTRVLDLAIEMPLKLSLRLAQQWVGFLRDKQEEL